MTIPHAPSRKKEQGKPISNRSSADSPQSLSHTLLNPHRQMRVFVAQADLYTLSTPSPQKTSTLSSHFYILPFSLKGVELTDYQPPSSPGAVVAHVDSHTHLSLAAPCNPDNTISRGGKVCRFPSCSCKGGETTLCRTVGSLAIIHHLPSTSPSLLS